jgi:hypothetical protein
MARPLVKLGREHPFLNEASALRRTHLFMIAPDHVQMRGARSQKEGVKGPALDQRSREALRELAPSPVGVRRVVASGDGDVHRPASEAQMKSE